MPLLQLLLLLRILSHSLLSVVTDIMDKYRQYLKSHVFIVFFFSFDPRTKEMLEKDPELWAIQMSMQLPCAQKQFLSSKYILHRKLGLASYLL